MALQKLSLSSFYPSRWYISINNYLFETCKLFIIFLSDPDMLLKFFIKDYSFIGNMNGSYFLS